jgi:NTP pyrophosphatase (non-canonical NTP hydrolase)
MNHLQETVKNFVIKYDLTSPIEHRVLDLSSEVGELSKEVLKMSNYGKNPLVYRQEFKEELGDVFYSLITIANHFDIDMEEALTSVLQKYERRLAKWWAWSENQ